MSYEDILLGYQNRLVEKRADWYKDFADKVGGDERANQLIGTGISTGIGALGGGLYTNDIRGVIGGGLIGAGLGWVGSNLYNHIYPGTTKALAESKTTPAPAVATPTAAPPAAAPPAAAVTAVAPAPATVTSASEDSVKENKALEKEYFRLNPSTPQITQKELSDYISKRKSEKNTKQEGISKEKIEDARKSYLADADIKSKDENASKKVQEEIRKNLRKEHSSHWNLVDAANKEIIEKNNAAAKKKIQEEEERNSAYLKQLGYD